jgi:hypothetical protein
VKFTTCGKLTCAKAIEKTVQNKRYNKFVNRKLMTNSSHRPFHTAFPTAFTQSPYHMWKTFRTISRVAVFCRCARPFHSQAKREKVKTGGENGGNVSAGRLSTGGRVLRCSSGGGGGEISSIAPNGSCFAGVGRGFEPFEAMKIYGSFQYGDSS